MDDHGSGTSPRIVAIAPQAWSEAPIGLIKKDSTKGWSAYEAIGDYETFGWWDLQGDGTHSDAVDAE